MGLTGQDHEAHWTGLWGSLSKIMSQTPIQTHRVIFLYILSLSFHSSASSLTLG